MIFYIFDSNYINHIKMVRCILCGNNEEFKEHLCRECYLKEHPIIKNIKPFSITKCSKCNKIKFKHKGFSSFSEGLKKELISHIKLNQDYKFEDLILNSKEEKDTLIVEMIIKAKVDNKKVEEPYSIVLPLNKTICPRCGNKNSEYFEGVLQIRCEREEILKEIIKEILSKPELVKISSLIKYEKGFNIQFRDITKIRKLVEELKKKFKGYSTYSNQVFSKDAQTSKEVLRTNIKYIPSPFKKGDIIQKGNNVYEVKKTDPFMFFDIEKKELKHFNKSLAEKDFNFLQPQACQLIKMRPEPTVLNPSDFKEIKVTNPEKLKEKDIGIGDYVKAIIIKEKAYLL
jgi:NMD protein affecting ribosome stability and mRNA decay